MSEFNRPPESCLPPELAVIVPIYNEAGNIEALAERLRHSLQGLDWELIFVDDNSPDGSADKAQEIAQRDRRIRVLRRIGRRGLSSACIEGMLATVAPYLAVLDGDLQHDETLLPSMLQTLKREGFDIVVGSRYLEGGGLGTWNRRRRFMSRFASRLARTLIKANLSDPLSGFFMLNATLLHSCMHNLSGIGFKILLDIFTSSPRPLCFQEIPYVFRERRAGESKLDNAVLWEYLLMLVQKTTGSIVPVRFIGFSLIGGSGIIVHMVMLWALFRLMGASFMISQSVAVLVAMTANFFLNNMLTYRDLRLYRWQLLRGWLFFILACSIGAITNVGIATYLFQSKSYWVISAFAGILVGAIWNYAVTAVYTWHNKPS